MKNQIRIRKSTFKFKEAFFKEVSAAMFTQLFFIACRCQHKVIRLCEFLFFLSKLSHMSQSLFSKFMFHRSMSLLFMQDCDWVYLSQTVDLISAPPQMELYCDGMNDNVFLEPLHIRTTPASNAALCVRLSHFSRYWEANAEALLSKVPITQLRNELLILFCCLCYIQIELHSHSSF